MPPRPQPGIDQAQEQHRLILAVGVKGRVLFVFGQLTLLAPTGRLGLHRALLHQEREGTLEIFRPYALPDPDWLAQASQALARLTVALCAEQRGLLGGGKLQPREVGDAVDLNGFPAKADLVPVAVVSGSNAIATTNRPQVFNQMCVACHTLDGQGGQVGPALDDVGSRKNADDIRAWLHDPQASKPGAKMPKLPLTDEQIGELAAFLSQKKKVTP